MAKHWLSSFVIFQGIQTTIAKKNPIFLWFSRRKTDPLSPLWIWTWTRGQTTKVLTGGKGFKGQHKDLYFSLKMVPLLIILWPYFISILCRSKTNPNERIRSSAWGHKEALEDFCTFERITYTCVQDIWAVTCDFQQCGILTSVD